MTGRTVRLLAVLLPVTNRNAELANGGADEDRASHSETGLPAGEQRDDGGDTDSENEVHRSHSLASDQPSKGWTRRAAPKPRRGLFASELVDDFSSTLPKFRIGHLARRRG